MQSSKGDMKLKNRLWDGGEGERDDLREQHSVIYITISKADSPPEFDVWCREPKTSAPWQPKGLGREGGGVSREGAKCITNSDSCWYMEKNHNILQLSFNERKNIYILYISIISFNYPWIKEIKRTPQQRTRDEISVPTDTVVSPPLWLETPGDWAGGFSVLAELVDLNLHGSFPCVPFGTKISFGVYTSKADTAYVTVERRIRTL